jgi:membrane protease YdiL (CAAX protease family)
MSTGMETAPAPGDAPPQSPRRALLLAGVLFALVYPTIITWGYFILAEQYSTAAQQATYAIVKVIQFAFPLFWVWFVLREPLRVGRVTGAGLAIASAFSVVVIGAGWILFDLALADLPIFSHAADLIRAKIKEFGVNSVFQFIVLAAFYSLVHSLLEEYYWRWFVFQQLQRLVALWQAILVSALGFAAHHVIVLHEFFEEAPALAWLLSAAVAIGGAFWAWLYARSGSLIGPWLSHLLIDAGVFWIGFRLVRDALAS